MRLAKEIVLNDEGLSIDGEKLDWFVGADMVVTNMGGMKKLTVEIFCDEVTVESIPSNCEVTLVDDRTKELA